MPARFRPALFSLDARDTPAGLFATADASGSVTAYDADGWGNLFQVTPFPDLAGPVRTTTADVNGDGTTDVIAAAGPGGAPVVKVYSGVDGQLLSTYIVGDEADRSGVGVTAAGSDASGPLLAVTAVVNGQSTVKLIRGADGTVVEQFAPFDGFTGALSIAAADVNGDGTTDLVVGAGAGGAPRVAVYSGTDRTVLFDELVFEPSFTGGVDVSVGDLSGDGRGEVVVAANRLGGPRVSVFDPTTWTLRNNFFAFDSGGREGVRAAVFATVAGGSNALITTDGLTGGTSAFAAADMASTTAPSLSGLPGGGVVSTVAPSLAAPPDADGLLPTMPDLSGIAWQTLASGVQIQDEVEGDGTAVTESSTVTVYYAGYLTDGTEFDSTRAPSDPAEFALSGLITGWQDGLLGMRVGGVRRMYIPAALAYGDQDNGAIPANSDLVFEVKLVAVA